MLAAHQIAKIGLAGTSTWRGTVRENISTVIETLFNALTHTQLFFLRKCKLTVLSFQENSVFDILGRAVL